MITIFSLPKGQSDTHISTIQQNAVNSWRELGEKVQIIIMGEGVGLKDLAKSCNANYVSNLTTNEFGTPLLNDAFNKASKLAKYKVIMYTNADMIYGQDLIKAISNLTLEDYLVIGQRWDLNVTTKIKMVNNWWDNLTRDKSKRGVLHPPAGSDYFIFKKGNFKNLPAFAVGRVKWDNWMIMSALKNHFKVIDATKSITAIHQNHDYSHLRKSKNVSQIEQNNNGKLSGMSYIFDIKDANWVINDELKLIPQKSNCIVKIIYQIKMLLIR